MIVLPTIETLWEPEMIVIAAVKQQKKQMAQIILHGAGILPTSTPKRLATFGQKYTLLMVWIQGDAPQP